MVRYSKKGQKEMHLQEQESQQQKGWSESQFKYGTQSRKTEHWQRSEGLAIHRGPGKREGNEYKGMQVSQAPSTSTSWCNSKLLKKVSASPSLAGPPVLGSETNAAGNFQRNDEATKLLQTHSILP